MLANSTFTALIKVSALCFLGFLLAGLATIFLGLPRLVGTEEVTVPNLAGQDYWQAVELLHNAGLQVDFEIEEKSSSHIPKGHVIDQDPRAFFKVKTQKQVQITLSIGDEFVQVPDIRGRSLKSVERLLGEAGFRRGRVAEVHSDLYPQAGLVIAQTPLSDTMHQRGDAIHLLLSLGARPRVLLMPNLRGKPIDNIRSLLKTNGLTVGAETYESHRKIPRGKVISHDPPAGALVHVGAAIKLKISGSPKALINRGRLVPVRYRISENSAVSTHLRIVIADERRNLTIVNDYYEPGMLIERPPVRVFGEAKMSIYEEGVEIEKRDVW